MRKSIYGFKANMIINLDAAISQNGTYDIVRNRVKLMEIKASNWMEARRFAGQLLSGEGYSVNYTARDGVRKYRAVRGDISTYANSVIRLSPAIYTIQAALTGDTPPLVKDVQQVNPFAKKIPAYVWRAMHRADAIAFAKVCSALMEQGKRMAKIAAKREQLVARRTKLLDEVSTLDAELKTVEQEFASV